MNQKDKDGIEAMAGFIKCFMKRSKGPTPPFFKKLRQIGLVIAFPAVLAGIICKLSFFHIPHGEDWSFILFTIAGLGGGQALAANSASSDVNLMDKKVVEKVKKHLVDTGQVDPK